MNFLHSIALAGAALLLAGPAFAEHRKLVGDTVINIGIVPAHTLLDDVAERQQHGSALDGSGRQHLVVSAADVVTGRPVSASEVVVRVQDPKGRIEERKLVAAAQNGIPEHSGVFRFGWSGTYRLQVRVSPPEPATPTVADFAWTHAIP
jgi:hypothetical protein